MGGLGLLSGSGVEPETRGRSSSPRRVPLGASRSLSTEAGVAPISL